VNLNCKLGSESWPELTMLNPAQSYENPIFNYIIYYKKIWTKSVSLKRNDTSRYDHDSIMIRSDSWIRLGWFVSDSAGITKTTCVTCRVPHLIRFALHFSNPSSLHKTNRENEMQRWVWNWRSAQGTTEPHKWLWFYNIVLMINVSKDVIPFSYLSINYL
jgi:hypothetical protein